MNRLSPLVMLLLPCLVSAQDTLTQDANTWVKRSPLQGGPRSPMLGYEGTFGYDPLAKKLIRWAGHTQSGGHEQMNETWTYDPLTAEFKLIDTNTSPPGVCCGQQNIFDPVGNRFLRFRAFSGSHGWHWFRENYLTNSSVWNFNLATKTWINMKPLPEPLVSPLRCASWDSDEQVVVVFGGEGNNEGTVVYDPYENTWKRMNPKTQPAPRSGGSMAYDSKRKRHILFGAQFSEDPHTWAYDLKKNEWTSLQPKLQPNTKANDAVLVYDSHNDVIVASVKSHGNEDAKGGSYETWVFLGDDNTWKKMETKETPPGFGNRRRIMEYIPDLNVTLMENYVNPPQKIPGVDREQQMWTYRYGDGIAKVTGAAIKPRTKPGIVETATASVLGPKQVALAWSKPRQGDIAGYHVERAAVDVFTEDEIQRLRKDTVPLAEPSVGGIKAIGEFTRLTTKPLTSAAFEDTTVDLSKPATIDGKTIFLHRFSKDQVNADGKKYRFGVYAYRIRAVDQAGVESGPSPYVLTIPSAPEHLYSKEAGDDCHLKWAKNAESGIAGYRVYRMESPRINGPGQKVTRLTEQPITQTTYLDKGIGKEPRRYWIVAVDALGQEGTPSAPTWHYRFFKSHYDPFTGEWHQ